jgi:hypothetical protein
MSVEFYLRGTLQRTLPAIRDIIPISSPRHHGYGIGTIVFVESVWWWWWRGV